jgi:Glycosyl transferase family 2
MPDGSLQVVDVLQCLREDEAVEAARWHGIGSDEVADDRCVRIARIDVEDVAALDGGAESSGVVPVQHLEDTAANRPTLGGEELLDVVTVDRSAAVASVVVAERFGPADRPEPGRVPHPLQAFPPPQRIGRRAELPRRTARAHDADVIASFAHRWVRGHDHRVMAETGRRVFRVPPAIGGLELGPVPTFSVVIAAYNGAATIAEAVESALAQTLPPLEVIVCDDGSTDHTVAALEPFLDRIVLLRKTRGGAASARNEALQHTRGDFLAVLDADDAYLPERLEALTELAVARPDLDILCTDAFLEVDRGPVATFSAGCAFEITDQRTAILERCFCVAPAYRRSTLVAAGGFDESLRTGSDWECVIRLVCSGALAGAVDEPLYRYRFHDRSLTSDRVRTLKDRVELLEHVGRVHALDNRERAALASSLAAQRAYLALTEAEAALRSRSRDARKRALAAARMPAVAFRSRAAVLAAALAPEAAARALERREARRGHSRLRRTLPGR